MTAVPSWWTEFHAGDLNAFAALIERYQEDVFAVAIATVIDRALAEDVAQETFIAAHTHREQVRDPAALGGWLAAIARNLGRDVLRARQRETLVDPPELEIATDAEPPGHQLDRATLCHQVRCTLARVPVRYREVLILYYACERSIASIAESLGLTESATMQRLSRGRRLVKRHAGDLHEHLRGTVPRRSRAFALGVLALLAIRSASAQAAPARRSFAHRFLVGIAGLGLVMGFTGVDSASGRDPLAQPIASPTTPAPSSTARRAPRQAPASRATNPAPAIARRPVTPVARTLVATIEPAWIAEDARPAAAEEPAVKPPGLQLATPSFECSRCSTETPPAGAARIDPVNGMLETAAIPRPGELSFETRGFEMMVRVGLTRNLAVHVGMVPMSVDQGTAAANVNPAFGGGIKLGTRLGPRTSLAVLAEGAREVNLKTTSTGDGWLGRIYAAMTLGTGRTNATFIAGVASEFDGNLRWTSPILGLSSHLGWDDNVGFLIEGQRFTTPNGSINGTSVFAVRFRNQHPTRRVRIDVGAMLLERTADEVTGLPWLQAGFGW